MTNVQLFYGDCTEIMPQIPSGSVDAVITDPPYPHIKRDYGMMTEAEWWEMMMIVCAETRRILKPTGSAVFILQPNSRKVGSMRGWLWEFMAWVCREWNMVQDVWWWNFAALPSATCQHGLMRGSVKAVVWGGEPDCYRDQSAVLWEESDESKARRLSSRVDAREGFRSSPSGLGVNRESMNAAVDRKGGVAHSTCYPSLTLIMAATRPEHTVTALAPR